MFRKLIICFTYSTLFSAGMWLIGVTCLVDVVTSTATSVSVLMDEFEGAGGKNVLLHILLGEEKGRREK